MIVDELRVVGSPQTNVVMGAEVIRIAQRALGRRPPEPRKEGLGQLVYPFDAELAAALVTYARTPTRIVWDCFRLAAQRLDALYDELCADLRADTRQHTGDGDRISVEVRRVESFPAGERQIVGTVKNALVDSAVRKGQVLVVAPEDFDALWVARVDDSGALVVSRDLGGRSLSQRGWRLEQGEAPLREHLAAVLLMLCRYDPRRDLLVDPMCGAGTIPIEAVELAYGRPRPLPHTIDRRWGFRAFTGPLFPTASPTLLAVGCDRDLDALAMARDNARRAGASAETVWQRSDVAHLTPDLVRQICDERGRAWAPGLLLCNPPYGHRLHPDDLLGLYDELARAARRFAGWRIGVLTASPLIERVFGRPAVKKPLANGPLRSYFYLFQL